MIVGDSDVGGRDRGRSVDYRGSVHEGCTLDDSVHAAAEERCRCEAFDDNLDGPIVHAAEQHTGAGRGCIQIGKAVESRGARGRGWRGRHHVAAHVAVPLVKPPAAIRVGVGGQEAPEAPGVGNVPVRNAGAIDLRSLEFGYDRRASTGLALDIDVRCPTVFIDADRKGSNAQLLF